MQIKLKKILKISNEILTYYQVIHIELLTACAISEASVLKTFLVKCT